MKEKKIFPFDKNCLDTGEILTVKSVPEAKLRSEIKEPLLKCRHAVVFVGFLVFFLFNAFRINTSVGLVAMVNNTAVLRKTKTVSISCSKLIPNTSTQEDAISRNYIEDGEFDWSPETQGYIQGSYFISYIIFLMPAAKLIERYGFKWFLFWSILITAVCTLLIPIISWQGPAALIAIQAVRGFVQGIPEPALSILAANWIPKTERGKLNTILKSGAPLGSCLGSVAFGFLCASLGRWPSSFYAVGTTGIIVSALIALFIHENPRVHPKISKTELNYILSNQECKLNKRRPKIPWGKILTSAPTYAYIYSILGHFWAVAQFLTVHSIFLETILHYPIAQNGFFNSLTFLLQFLTGQISGFISSYMQRKKFASVDFLRKFWTVLATGGYSASLLGIYYAGCNRNLSIVFAILSMSFNGLNFAGCGIVANDMTPTFAGSFTSLSLAIGGIAFVTFPLLVGHLTSDMQTIEQWNKIFFISIAIVLSSGILFAIFGSAEVQPWNFVDEEDKNKKEDMVEKTRF